MAVAVMPSESSRREQEEVSRLAWAFGISLAIHLLICGGYLGGRKLNLWDKLHLPAFLTPPKKVVEVLKKELQPPKQPSAPPALVFVDVSAAQAVAEPPTDTKYYSDRSS